MFCIVADEFVLHEVAEKLEKLQRDVAQNNVDESSIESNSDSDDASDTRSCRSNSDPRQHVRIHSFLSVKQSENV